MTGPGARDWDKELANIDKIIAKTPPAQVPPAAPAPSGPAPAPRAGGGAPAKDPSGGRRGALSTWLRVVLGALLAVGMTQWPYAHACGTANFIYLGATGVVVLAGVWAAASSWRRRLGLAHTVSLLVVLAGLVLAAREVLPRIGYARHAAVWFCS